MGRVSHLYFRMDLVEDNFVLMTDGTAGALGRVAEGCSRTAAARNQRVDDAGLTTVVRKHNEQQCKFFNRVSRGQQADCSCPKLKSCTPSSQQASAGSR